MTVGIYSDEDCSEVESKIIFKNDPELCQPMATGFAKGSCRNGQVFKKCASHHCEISSIFK